LAEVEEEAGLGHLLGMLLTVAAAVVELTDQIAGQLDLQTRAVAVAAELELAVLVLELEEQEDLVL